MTELRIHRDIFLTKVKQLFDPTIVDISYSFSRASEFKNAIYITFLLSLKDFREQRIYETIGESNKWYINLLEHVVNNDIAKLTDEEKAEISKMLNEKLEIKLSTIDKMIDVIENIKRPQNQKKLSEYIDNVFTFPKQIEDTYIKNRLLENKNININEYLDSLNLKPIIERINKLKNGRKFNETEIIVFKTFSKIKYIAYSSEIETFLMKRIPRYAQYMAMRFTD